MACSSNLPGPSAIPAIPVAFEPTAALLPAIAGSASPLAVVHQYFVATPTAARWARRHAAAVLTEWGLAEMEPTVVQVVAELVANAAARPAASPNAPNMIGLTLRLLPRRVTVEVSDPDPAVPALAQADLEDERGRGLAIVRALACGLEVVPLARGKVVVAQVRCPTRIGDLL